MTTAADEPLNTGTEVLDRGTCFALLAEEEVGRVAFVGEHGRVEVSADGPVIPHLGPTGPSRSFLTMIEICGSVRCTDVLRHFVLRAAVAGFGRCRLVLLPALPRNTAEVFLADPARFVADFDVPGT
jgi:hypothetical protein